MPPDRQEPHGWRDHECDVHHILYPAGLSKITRGMRIEPRRKLRIVIQFVSKEESSHYTLIAYGDGNSFVPVRFSSIHELSMRFAEARIPLERQPMLEQPSGLSQIVYSGDFSLSDTQLGILGLKRKSPQPENK